MFPTCQQTPFDLTFRLFGFPVRVHPLFWLGAALLGSFYFRVGFEIGLIWVLCVFVSLLVHELGHTFAIRYYGSPAAIWLFIFGGLAIPTYTPTSPWRRLAIALAGPAAGFLLLALLWVSNRFTGWSQAGGDRLAIYLGLVYIILFNINLIWSLINLLPIWPLDGGRALREIFDIVRLRRPDYTALQVSVAVGGALAVYGLLLNINVIPDVLSGTPFWWAAPSPLWTLFLFMLAIQSYMMLRQFGGGPRLYSDDDRLPWEKQR